jgi:hypothetical protein
MRPGSRPPTFAHGRDAVFITRVHIGAPLRIDSAENASSGLGFGAAGEEVHSHFDAATRIVEIGNRIKR